MNTRNFVFQNLFHRRTRSYSCETCGGRFSTLRVLRHHIRTQPHHKFYCQECGISYAQKQQYLSHMLTHGLRCTLCNRSFSSAVAAHQHYRTTHSQPESYTSKSSTTVKKYDIPENVTPCIRTHSLYETRDQENKRQTEMLSLRDKITIKQEDVDIKCEGYEDEDSVVIILSSEGEAEIAHYSQAETDQALQHITEDDSYVFSIDEKEIPQI